MDPCTICDKPIEGKYAGKFETAVFTAFMCDGCADDARRYLYEQQEAFGRMKMMNNRSHTHTWK